MLANRQLLLEGTTLRCMPLPSVPPLGSELADDRSTRMISPCRIFIMQSKQKCVSFDRNAHIPTNIARASLSSQLFFPGPLAFCKKAVERVNSEKNILNR